jgi:hypothetical protein
MPRYLDFPCLPTRNGKPVLNKYSAVVTNGHDFPGAKVSLPNHLQDRFLCGVGENSAIRNFAVYFLSGSIYLIDKGFNSIGYAICRWCAGPQCHEHGPPRWNLVSLVGRQSVQVMKPPSNQLNTSPVILLTSRSNIVCIVSPSVQSNGFYVNHLYGITDSLALGHR